ncbi:hypothetical protein ABVT39_009199 [Epinephelus coioides]
METTAEAARVEAPAGAVVREEPAGAGRKGPPARAAEEEAPAWRARLGTATGSDSLVSGEKSSRLRASYRLDSWSSQGDCRLVLQAFLPDATYQDSYRGVEFSDLCFGFGVETTAAAGTSLGFAPSNSQQSSGWRCGDGAEAASPDEAGAPPGPGTSWETEAGAALAEAGGSTSVAGMVRSNSAELAGEPAPSLTIESSSFSSFRIQQRSEIRHSRSD